VIEVLIVVGAVVVFARVMRDSQPAPTEALAPRRITKQLTTLVTYADRLYSEKKWLAAEKAYLNVLKLDHKNLTAYSHLGIIYSTQKNLADAIECFEIAARLKPGAPTYQNLGLSYYENRNYMKAIAAFDKSIMFEPTAPRFIGLSKAYKKVNNTTGLIASLEHAAELDQSMRVQELLIGAYIDAGRPDDAKAVRERLGLPATVPAEASAKS
jgi:tetratricopeptide (TPR) repeat protein